MGVNEDIVMWNGGHGDKMKFELHKAGCFLKVGVTKAGQINTATRAARVLKKIEPSAGLKILSRNSH